MAARRFRVPLRLRSGVLARTASWARRAGGGAPTLTVQLECALAEPSRPAPAPAPPPGSAPAPAPADPGPVPSVPADEVTPGPLPAGASFPAGYPNVACADGKTYLDENGDNKWVVDPEDPQNSPCNQG
jgi:hypothetical protein